MPDRMFFDGLEVEVNLIPDCFVNYLEGKVSDLSTRVSIDAGVYNGSRKVVSTEKNFMTKENIIKAVKLIKNKNSEGHDMIPQRAMIDGIDILIDPLVKLFNNIYIKKEIPEQWKLAKITPVFNLTG